MGWGGMFLEAIQGGWNVCEGESKRDQWPHLDAICPSLSPSFLSVAQPFAVAWSGLTEDPAPHVLGYGSPGFLRKGRRWGEGESRAPWPVRMQPVQEGKGLGRAAVPFTLQGRGSGLGGLCPRLAGKLGCSAYLPPCMDTCLSVWGPW